MSHNGNTTLILDNGAHTIKAGLSAGVNPTPRILYNAAIRSKGDKQLYIGLDFDKCHDYASLSYRLAFERGYLIDWDVEKAVWDNLFGPDALALDFSSTSLLITEPPFNFHSTQEKYDQLVFEEYEFDSYARCPAASLMKYGGLFNSKTSPSRPFPECALIIDSGFSFTHVLPIMQGAVLWNGVRRLDVGGKLLTNHLSTLVSFRQWNMLDQTYIINDVKEKCCFVSSSFKTDLERSRMSENDITLQYVLPDFSRNRHGFVRKKTKPQADNGMDIDTVTPEPAPSDSDQVLLMTNERFSVPELIFNPSDIGLSQAGLPELISHSISSLPPDLQGMFWANIGLIGGSVQFPGFAQRLEQELRALAPGEYQVGVYKSKNPLIETYKSAHAFSNSEDFPSICVTKAEYSEGGSNACRRKFRQFDWDPIKEKPPAPRFSRRDKTESKDVEEYEKTPSEMEVEGKKAFKKAPARKREKLPPAKPKRELRHK
ncbi:actin-domain-containing protein [Hysterangium stoloniferum]|nr:actin-domain-containing protein [Hysterangium stoloniferum]